jgi:hypothetical protein
MLKRFQTRIINRFITGGMVVDEAKLQGIEFSTYEEHDEVFKIINCFVLFYQRFDSQSKKWQGCL